MLSSFALVLTGCDRAGNLAREAFEESSKSDICLEMNGGRVFTYDENTCQTSYIESANEFRVGKDDMSDFYIVQCNATPKEGEHITANLIWTTANDIRERKNLEFKVLKTEKGGEKIWLWCQSLRAGVVVKKP